MMPKERLHEKASELFLEGHHIYIDTSTTLTLLVRLIPDMRNECGNEFIIGCHGTCKS